MSGLFVSELLKNLPKDTNLEFPPKIFNDMESEIVEFIKDERLVARFPNKSRYMNPFGFMQGGIIVAAIDNTISPLIYTAFGPNVTLEINTMYKRPIKNSDRFVEVVATIMNKTSSHITLQAEVLNEKRKLAAKAIATCVFVKGNRRE
jgi:uncharacterized protein (TIGR00369 family)